MAQIVRTRNPLFPTNGREIFTLEDEQAGKSIAEVLKAFDINLAGALDTTAVFLNDQLVKPEEFDTTIVGEKDLVAVKALVKGGGGSNVWSILALIVVAVASYFTAGAAAAAYGAGWGAVAGAAVMIVGSLLINHFLGPSFNTNSSALAQTYSISGSSNAIRLGQPMPIVFGTYLMAPDVGANPYIVYEGNDQFLYEIFNWGYSDLEIGTLAIGGSPISEFANVTIQWSTNGALTLFPSNVVVSAGATLTQSGGAITRTTAVNCTSVGIDIAATLFMSNSDGSLGSESVVIYPQYKLTTATEWSDLIPLSQGEIANGTYYNYNRGNYSTYNTQNVWTLTNDNSSPYYESFTAQLPAAGQYDIRLTRLTNDIDDTTHYADTTWTQLRSYQPDTTDYSGQTRLAVKIEATSQLNGTISQLQALVSAKCPVYNSSTSTWSTTTTSNPAWWYLWFARGLKDENGVRILGAGLSDSQIDIDGIIEWAGWCDANDLAFNYILGDAMVVTDVLRLIARVGRGTPTWSKGVLGVVYDQEGLPVSQMFGMSNIKAGSFQINYTSDQLAQQVNVQFINPDLEYAQDVVSAIVPGVTSPEFSSTIQIPGITSKTQAAQEANLQAAAQTLFRRTTQFETDIEGLVCNRGDVIQVSHDLTSWSISGRLGNGAGSATVLILDREITISSSTQPYISVRHPDGTIETIEVEKNVGTTNTVTLTTALGINPYTDTNNSPIDYIYQFDPAETPGRTLKVVAVEPQGNNDNWVKLTCRDEVASYYDSATNPDWIYTTPTLLNQGEGSITNVGFTEHTNQATGEVTVTISWLFNGNIAGALLLVQTGQGAYISQGTIYAQQYVMTFAKPTTINIKLTPVALAEIGANYTTVTASYAMLGTTQQTPESISALIPTVTGLQLVGNAGTNTFTGKDAKFQWRINSSSAPEVGSEPQGGDSGATNPYFLDYQITIVNTDNSTRRIDYTQNTSYTYTYEMNSEDGDGVPTRAFTINVVARGQQNQISPNVANLSVSNPAPAVPTGITLAGGFQSINIQYQIPNDTDFVGILVYYSTNISATLSESTLLGAYTSNNFNVTNLTSGDTYYFYFEPYDAFGQTGLNASSQYSCPTVMIGTIDLGPGSVTATILANAAVTTAKIVPGAVTSTILAAEAVNNAALAAAAVATSNIQSAAITNALLAANAVATSNIQPAAVTTALIANNAVNTVNINTGAITTALIASGAVTGANIAANTITASNIVSGTITTTQIAAGTILGTNIAANTITGGLIAATTITASNIVAGTITSTQIAANTITAGNLAANSVTAASILAGTITSLQIAANTIVASNIQAGAITTATIAAGAITTSTLAAGAVTASTIAAGTITSTQIAASTILGSNIAAATITGGNITALTITAGNIAANTITSGQIAANTIVAGNLSVLTASGTSIDMSQGHITMNNGTYMKVIGTGFGNASQFIEWYGPSMTVSSCSELNAISYQKVDGTSYYNATVAINGVLGSFVENISGLEYYATIPSTLTGSLVISNGRTKTISVNLSTPGWNYNYSAGTNPGSGTGTATITLTLQRSVSGGGWTTLATYSASGTVGNSWDGGTSHTGTMTTSPITGSWTYSDTDSTAAVYQYQLLMTYTPALATYNPIGDGVLSLQSTEPTS